MSKTPLLTAETAAKFPTDFNDGFARPHLGWSAFGPQHLEGVGGSCMTSNVWIGDPIPMRVFIETLAAHYESMKEDIDTSDFDEYEGISLCYWERDGLAMIGEFCVGDTFFEQKTDALYDAMSEMTLLLADGNDNDAGFILQNNVETEPLDVYTRLLLAHFMNSGLTWPLAENPTDNPEDVLLPGFTADDKIRLAEILQINPV